MWMWAVNAFMAILFAMNPGEYQALLGQGMTTGAWVCVNGPCSAPSPSHAAPVVRMPRSKHLR